MAYNSDNNSRYIAQNLGSVFGTNKAYTIGATDRKFKLAIASCVSNNGKQDWDFRNMTYVYLDHEDLNRLYMAAKNIYHIVINRELHPELKNKGGIWTADRCTFPLVAKSTGKKFGDVTVGVTADPVDKSKFTFAFSYTYNAKDEGQVKDSFVFIRSSGLAGNIVFSNAQNEQVHESMNEHLQFLDFILNVESLLRYGRLSIANQVSLMPSKSGNNGGGNSYGGKSKSGGNSDFGGGSDVPF